VTAAAGDSIGKFKVIRLLGEGGMGSVYLAQDPRVKPPRMVAIKMLRDNSPELRERFDREVGVIANFEHPNIVHVFEVDEHDGHPFMAMAYVKGETLLEMIRRRAPMPLVRKLQIIEHLCAGLAYAHRQGVIHRDVKPGNIMVDAEETLKVLDFGIARLADSTLTVSGSIIGTPNYMSPEQVTGQPLGPSSDIFAVGAVAYEIIGYRQAFPGKVPEVLGRIQYSQPMALKQIQPGIDPAIVEVIDRALKKDTAERYQELTEMQRDIARIRTRLERAPEDKTIVEAPRRPQIDTLLASAREALAAGDFAAARARAAQILEIDTKNAAALALDQSAHAGELERQNREWLAKAQALLAADNLTGADEVLQELLRQTPNVPAATKLRAEIAMRRQRQEEEAAHKRAVSRALARARTQVAEGAFEAALRSLDEVFALSPDNPDARTLAEQARAGTSDRVRNIEETRRQAIADCLEAGLSAAAAERFGQAAEELAEIRRIDPNADAAARLERRIEEARAAAARRELTVVEPPPAFTPKPTAPETATPAPEKRPLSEAARMERAGLRAFYRAEYDKAIEVFERIPATDAAADVPRDRVLFYMACSTAALALLEGDKGTARLQKARELYQQSQREKNPFTVHRKYISPRILDALSS